MLLTEKDAERRLNDPSNLAVIFKDTTEFKANRKIAQRGPPLPRGLKAEIAVDVALGLDTQEEIAANYGVSIGTVQDSKRQFAKDPRVEAVRSQIRDVAFDRLMSTMGYLTDDKLSGESAKSLASIASNMAKVVQQTAEQTNEDERIKLIVFVPTQKTDADYTVIDV